MSEAYTPVRATRVSNDISQPFPSSFNVKTSDLSPGLDFERDDAAQFQDINTAREQQAVHKIRNDLRLITLLSENGVSSPAFKALLPSLSAQLYREIRAERQLSSLCGYPICENTIQKRDVNQPLFSLRANQIIDVKELHTFCSKGEQHRSMRHRERKLIRLL